GLSLSTSGVLSGTPTTPGSYSFTVTATNSTGSDPQAYSGTVTTALTAPTITTTTLNAMAVSSLFSQTLASTGSPTITYAVTTGSLPAGLSLSSSGVLSGTPTTEGAYSFTVTASNSVGSDPQAYSGTVSAATSGSFVFAGRTPDTSGVYTDGGGSLQYGAHYYATVAWNCLGVRFWNPAGADSTFLNMNVTVKLYGRDYNGSPFTANMTTLTADRTKTHTTPRTGGTWTTVYFDAAMPISAVSSSTGVKDVALLEVYFDGNRYVIATHSSVDQSTFGPYTAPINGDPIYLAEVLLPRTTLSIAVASPVWHGIDCIYELV
ncbi:MAG: putative Ig domain-containing protein, partial [Paenisporosarcina sp.]